MSAPALTPRDVAAVREALVEMAEQSRELVLLLGAIALQADEHEGTPAFAGAQAMVARIGATADAAGQLCGAPAVLGRLHDGSICEWFLPPDLMALRERLASRSDP